MRQGSCESSQSSEAGEGRGPLAARFQSAASCERDVMGPAETQPRDVTGKRRLSSQFFLPNTGGPWTTTRYDTSRMSRPPRKSKQKISED